jgi:hypothetical protein
MAEYVADALVQVFLDGLDIMMNQAAVGAFVITVFDDDGFGFERTFGMVALADGTG